MRALLLCLIGLVTASSDLGLRSNEALAKGRARRQRNRYFTSIDGLMDGNADVILKETRQGKTVTAAVLDVCYPAEKGSDRKDRFVANLAVNGQNLTGTTQSLGDKLPVTVKLTRKPTGDSFEFKGQISVGQTVTEVTSSDNSDLSEKEFQDNQSTDDSITAAPKDFTEVSPESVARAGEAGCGAGFPEKPEGTGRRGVAEQPHRLLRRAARRRADHQHQRRSGSRRGPDRESQVGARRGRRRLDRGVVDMERTIRFAGGRLARRRQAEQGQARVGDRRRDGQNACRRSRRHRQWDANTGKLKLTFKRPSQVYPALELTDTIEVDGAGFARQARRVRPADALDRQSLHHDRGRSRGCQSSIWPTTSSGDEEGEQTDDNGSVDALAKEFKGQRWDADKSAWK